MPMTLVLQLDDRAGAHLRRALAEHGRWCRANGHTLPPALADLSAVITRGQEQADRDVDEELAEDATVTLLPYDETARRLGVSESTVRRLVRDQKLRAVHVGRRVLVHVDDLAAYMDRLRKDTAA